MDAEEYEQFQKDEEARAEFLQREKAKQAVLDALRTSSYRASEESTRALYDAAVRMYLEEGLNLAQAHHKTDLMLIRCIEIGAFDTYLRVKRTK